MSIDPYAPPKPESIRELESTRSKHHRILFSFTGRITRRVFLIYFLTVLPPLLGLMIVVDQLLFPLTFYGASASAPTSRSLVGSAILGLLAFPTLWIALALQVKRWHDHSKSAWWLLIWLFPIIGPLWVILELGFVRGSPFPNKYGQDPLRRSRRT